MQGKRYVKKYRGEQSLSRNVREMIAMIKNEEVMKGRPKYMELELSKHAKDRVIGYFGCKESYAIKKVRGLLRRSKRVGEQLAYDGRINVMFVCNQYAIYLSPNLKHVVTIHQFTKVSYNPIREILPELSQQLDGMELNKELVRLHKEAWNDLEKREADQLKLVLEIDDEVNAQLKKLEDLKKGFTPKHYRKYVNQRIAEEREKLFTEGAKLFNIKLEKRHVGKSITSVL